MHTRRNTLEKEIYHLLTLKKKKKLCESLVAQVLRAVAVEANLSKQQIVFAQTRFLQGDQTQLT